MAILVNGDAAHAMLLSGGFRHAVPETIMFASLLEQRQTELVFVTLDGESSKALRDFGLLAVARPDGGRWTAEALQLLVARHVVILNLEAFGCIDWSERCRKSLASAASRVGIYVPAEFRRVDPPASVGDWVEMMNRLAIGPAMIAKDAAAILDDQVPRFDPPPPRAAGELIDDEDDNPHRLAELFLRQNYPQQDGQRTLAYWQGDWHQWNGQRWVVVGEGEIRNAVIEAIRREFVRLSRLDRRPTRAVTASRTKNVIEAVRSLVHLPTTKFPEQPVWLDGQGRDPRRCIPAANGIVYVPTKIASEAPSLLKATPNLFSRTSVGFDLDLEAKPPSKWLEFLDSIWSGDQGSVACLQEWFGYTLLPDCSQQKILVVIGPPRSGKGTISRIWTALLGKENVANPTLSSLSTSFGIESLVGKPLAIISDARLSARTDIQPTIERLLSISGEDAVSVPRKHRTDWIGRLPTRFVLFSNETPAFGDASGALAGRMIVLRMTRSFLGREDEGLFDRLVPELPGIFLWSLEGLRRLHERRRFIQPETAVDLVDLLGELSAPIGQFIKDCCEVGPHLSVCRDVLYSAYCQWCETEGR